MTDQTYYGNSADGQIERVETIAGGSYTLDRGFLVFQISSPPFDLDEISSVVLRIVVSAVTGDTTYRCRSTKTGNADVWFNMRGEELFLALTNGDPDFGAVSTNIESDVGINEVGTYDFTINKNNLNIAGNQTYFRINCKYENNPANQGSITFASQNNSTQANRPQLIITYESSGVSKIYTAYSIP